MKEGLERLLKENIKMIEEVREIPKTLPCSSHAPLHVFPKVYTKS
jgi:hypothetical protein